MAGQGGEVGEVEQDQRKRSLGDQKASIPPTCGANARGSVLSGKGLSYL
jgi:hypothetical protein